MSTRLPLRSFFDEAAIRGRPADGFDADAVTTIGRGLSTKARRLTLADMPFCLAREPDGTGAVREGLVRGIVLSGQAVLDLGATSLDALHELAPDAARAFVRHEPDGTVFIDVWFGKTALSGPDTDDIVRLCEARRFASGAGELHTLDVAAARAFLDELRAAESFDKREKTDPAAKSDTTLVDAA